LLRITVSYQEKLSLKESLEQGSCAQGSNEMEKENYGLVLNAKVLIAKEKALANCDLVNCRSVLDAKDSNGPGT
jgi:hypothetical protein